MPTAPGRKKKNVAIPTSTAELKPKIPADSSFSSNFNNFAVAAPIAEPTTAPIRHQRRADRDPQGKTASRPGVLRKKTCPIPRKIVRNCGNGIVR